MLQQEKDIIAEAARQLTICNACRYCEGYCDVWDAIEIRREFSPHDVLHLANLCHDCRDCFYACPYIPPHEFAINIPKIMKESRMISYKQFVFPKAFRWILDRFAQTYFILTFLIFLALMTYVVFLHGATIFYKSYLPMQLLFPPYIFLLLEYSMYAYVFILWYIEGSKYWKYISKGAKVEIKSVFKALGDVFLHKNFRGGGTGCAYPYDKGNYFRLVAHALVMFGFIIDWVGILFYPFVSLSFILLYLLGSLMMFAGSVTLLIMSGLADKNVDTEGISSFSGAFLLLSVSGILFFLFLPTPTWTIFFLIRVSSVGSIFLLAPFSKFIHPIFRFLSLVWNRQEWAMQQKVMHAP
ncbi:MAG: hypothetical protein QXF82_03930 [Nitrososphaeria archaeon]